MATAEERSELLARARALDSARDNASVAELLSGVSDADLHEEPELAFLLTSAWRRIGEGARALQRIEDLLRSCRRQGREILYRRLLNLDAALHFDAGRLDDAARRWRRVADLSAGADDAVLLMNACNNVGVVQTLRGEVDAALASYSRALAAAQRLGDRRAIAQAHQNLAISYRELGFLPQSQTHFEAAIESARMDGSHDLVARAEEERALAILQAGDPLLAEVAARRALAASRDAKDPLGMGESHRVLGLVAMARARFEEAREHLEQALAAARAAGAKLLEAESLEAIAALADRNGKPELAAQTRSEAEEIFGTMSAQGWGQQVRARTRIIAEAHPA